MGLDLLRRLPPVLVRGQTGERLGDLANKPQVSLFQSGEKARAGAIALVEGQPVQHHPVGIGAIELLQGNLPLGAVNQIIREACGPAPFPVVGPTFGQEEVEVDEALEGTPANTGVNGDDR